jgi:hypothetical protein
VLPLLGIAALMVFGFVVFITALTYDSPVKSETPADLALARERRRRQQRERLRRQGQQASSGARWAVQAAAAKLGILATTLAQEWWPLLSHHTRRSRGWLSLESTSGQLIAAAAASVVVAYLLVAFV